MSKTVTYIIIGTIGTIGGFIISNLIDFQPLAVVLKGDLNTVIEQHSSDVKDIKIKTLDVKLELTEEQIRRLNLDLLKIQVDLEKLSSNNESIPVVYREREAVLNNEITNLSSTLNQIHKERILLVQ